jgi:hypothetical protein
MPLITVRGELQTPWTEGVNIRNLEENGFLKFDFLGIKQMKMVEDCIARILKRELGHDPEFAEIKKFYDDKLNCRYVEPNDDRVFDHVYRKNRWPGIFQFTSTGARKFCHEVQPNCIEDIGVVTAIYRPGPLKANVHKKYVEAKKDASKAVYDHPTIKDVLGNTYGFMCLAGDSKVTTEVGDLSIKEIVENKLQVKLPSFNIETGEIELDEVVQFHKQGTKETIIIETDNGEIELTPDHIVYTKRGKIEACQLKIDDEIICLNI